MRLGDFLAAVGGRRHEYGEWDCCVFPAAWAMACGYADPLADWRGRYTSGEDADGRLVEHFGAGLEAVGIVATDEPCEGDIGVVSILGSDIGAVFTGERWAIVAERGLIFMPVPPSWIRKAWRVAHG